MDFKDTIVQLSERILKLQENIETEEATKNAFVMPVLNALGYDVFNPMEVRPEFTCDICTKKGEKIDYAIMKDGKPIILIECKHWRQNLTLHDNQLMRYFSVSPARFGVLTNGVLYRFYTDIDKSNLMDEKPFLEIDMLALNDIKIEQLKKFHKSYFDENEILSTANELKLSYEVKNVIKQNFTSPSDEFARFFVKETNNGKYSSKQVEQYKPIIKKVIQSYINDVISERLNMAASESEQRQEEEKASQTQLPEDAVFVSDDQKVITTQDEMDAFMIVKNILRQYVDVKRICYKDYQSYFIINIDNSSKWICRLYFKKYRYIAFQTGEKKEEKFEIKSVDDIYSFSDRIVESLKKLVDIKIQAPLTI